MAARSSPFVARNGVLGPPVLDAIDDRTAVVAVPNCHWTDGSLLDLVEVGKVARDVGSALVVDATQSLGAMPFSVTTIQPDFVVAAGYKWLLGPFGLGYMWVAPERRDGAPIEENWITRLGADDFAGLVDYRDEYAPGARRFDVGERSSFQLVPMATAALEEILAWGVDEVAQRLGSITATIEQMATERGLSTIDSRASHLIGMRGAKSLPKRSCGQPPRGARVCQPPREFDSRRSAPVQRHIRRGPAVFRARRGALTVVRLGRGSVRVDLLPSGGGTTVGISLPEDLKAVIDARNFAHLVTLDPDGTPQASAMWIMREGDQIVFNTAQGRRKWRNMNSDPRVAVSISPADKPYENWSIQGQVAEMRTSDGVAVIDRLAQKYIGREKYPWLTPDMVRVTVVVDVERIAGSG